MGRWIIHLFALAWIATPVLSAAAASCGVAGDPSGAALRGKVQRAETARGIEGAMVILQGAGRRLELATRADGTFRFPGLPPGEYRVTAKSAGDVAVPESATVKLEPKGCAEVVIRMQPDRRIHGRVVDEDGKPAPRVRLVLVPFAALTVLSERNSIPVLTAENGEYSFKNVEPGQYYLGINLDRVPWPSEPYPRYFYPGTEDSARATVIHVPEDLPLTADLELPRRQAERTAFGTVVWPDGRPAAGAVIFLEDSNYPNQILVIQATADDQGAFSIKYYDSTRYIVHAVSQCKEIANCRSAEPYEILPGMTPSLRLVLTNKGHSAMDAFKRTFAAPPPARP